MGQMLSRDLQEAVNQLLPYFLARFGQNVVAGDVLPDDTASRDLGSSARKFDNIHAMNISADVIQAARVLVEGIGPNLLKNGSFEQVDSEHTNQPLYWVSSAETKVIRATGSG